MLLAALALAGLVGVLGCESSGGGGDTGGGGDVAGGEDTVGADQTGDQAAEARSVGVTYGGTTETVDLPTLATTDVEGVPLVRLSDVVAAAFPAVVLADVTADFVAGDGFRPGQSGNCADVVPIEGAALAQGYIDPATRDLAWDDALDFPGCMGVRDTATIELADKTTK